eukprot:1147439-Pelagomonas_calceolata.AAC.8
MILIYFHMLSPLISIAFVLQHSQAAVILFLSYSYDTEMRVSGLNVKGRNQISLSILGWVQQGGASELGRAPPSTSSPQLPAATSHSLDRLMVIVATAATNHNENVSAPPAATATPSPQMPDLAGKMVDSDEDINSLPRAGIIRHDMYYDQRKGPVRINQALTLLCGAHAPSSFNEMESQSPVPSCDSFTQVQDGNSCTCRGGENP